MAAKRISSLELALQDRPACVGLSRWLYDEFRRAILDRRLSPGTRLPATRDLANQYGISRGTVVSVFEQLESEGYLVGRPGAGTRVNALPSRNASAKASPPLKMRARYLGARLRSQFAAGVNIAPNRSRSPRLRAFARSHSRISGFFAGRELFA